MQQRNTQWCCAAAPQRPWPGVSGTSPSRGNSHHCGWFVDLPARSQHHLSSFCQPWSKWREEHMNGEGFPNVITDFWFSIAGSWIRPCRPSWPPVSEGKAHLGDKPSCLSLLKAIKLQKTFSSWKNRWHLPVIGHNRPLFKERMKVGDQKSLCGVF